MYREDYGDYLYIETNMDEVLRAFDRLGHAITNKVLEYACKEAAKPIESTWKQKARMRFRGRVPRSIRIRTESKNAAGVQVAIVSGARGFMGFEYGTSREAPHPAARPAFDEHKDAAVNTISNVIHDLLEGGRAL